MHTFLFRIENYKFYYINNVHIGITTYCEINIAIEFIVFVLCDLD